MSFAVHFGVKYYVLPQRTPLFVCQPEVKNGRPEHTRHWMLYSRCGENEMNRSTNIPSLSSFLPQNSHYNDIDNYIDNACNLDDIDDN